MLPLSFPVKVLVDASVMAAAKVAGSRWVGRPIPQTAAELDHYWKNGGPGGRIATVRLEIPVTKQGSTRRELECLATLTYENLRAVQFCTSALVQHEIRTQPPRRYREPFAGVHLFNETNFQQVPTPWDLQFEYLTALSLTARGRTDGNRAVAQVVRAVRDPRLIEMVCHTGNNKEADSFHIFTAQINNCAYFLTMDAKLLSHFNKHGLAPKLPWLNIRVVPPSTLVADLGLTPLDLDKEIERRTTWGYSGGEILRR